MSSDTATTRRSVTLGERLVLPEWLRRILAERALVESAPSIVGAFLEDGALGSAEFWSLLEKMVHRELLEADVVAAVHAYVNSSEHTDRNPQF